MTALALMNALIVYATLGAPAASLAFDTVAVSLVVGGAAVLLVGRTTGMVPGPTATSALVVSALIAQLATHHRLVPPFGPVLLATALTGVGAGLVPLLLSRARLGAVLKFIPYPVLMGFIDAVGVSLVVSVLPFALGHDRLGRLIEAATWFDGWHPAALAVSIAGAIVGYACAFRLSRVPAAFVALAVATALHHTIAATCSRCSLGPLLALGEATGGRHVVADLSIAGSSWSLLDAADWEAIAQCAVTLGILNAVFSLFTAAALTRAHDEPVDGNRILARIGGASVASGLALGLPVALIASVSRAVRQPAARTSTALAVYVVASTAIVVAGRPLFAMVPMAAVASAVFVIARTQFDSATWGLIADVLRSPARRATAAGPLAIVALVVAVAAFRTLAAALFVGALAAACLLALDLRRSVVLAIRDGRQRRSRRVWTNAERARLDAAGNAIVVVELAHWLYFGTADDLARLLDQHAASRWLVLDARRVSGIDLTAARSLVHAAARLAARGCHLVVAGIAPDDVRLRAIRALSRDDPETIVLLPDVDDALERAERDLVGDTGAEDAILSATVPGLTVADAERLERWLAPFPLAAGATLFNAGDVGDALYIVRRGRIRLSVDGEGGSRMRLLTFGPAGMFGEIALLDSRPRSTHAEAEEDCLLAMLSREGLAALADADPPLHATLLRALALQLADRLRSTTTMLQQMA